MTTPSMTRKFASAVAGVLMLATPAMAEDAAPPPLPIGFNEYVAQIAPQTLNGSVCGEQNSIHMQVNSENHPTRQLDYSIKVGEMSLGGKDPFTDTALTVYADPDSKIEIEGDNHSYTRRAIVMDFGDDGMYSLGQTSCIIAVTEGAYNPESNNPGHYVMTNFANTKNPAYVQAFSNFAEQIKNKDPSGITQKFAVAFNATTQLSVFDRSVNGKPDLVVFYADGKAAIIGVTTEQGHKPESDMISSLETPSIEVASAGTQTRQPETPAR